jgi:hypothetical protein
LDKRILALGVVLIIIAVILGALRASGAYAFGGHETAVYGGAGIIGVIGIILAAWSYMMKPKPKAQTPVQKQTQKQ